MSQRTRSAFVAAGLLAGVAGFAVGCSSSNNDTAATTTSTTTTAKSQSFAVDTPDGQVSLSLDGKLPPNWPSAFPVPDGATPAGSGSVGGKTSGTLVAVYSTSQKAEDAYNFYKQDGTLNAADPSQAGIGNAFVGKMAISGEYDGSITVVGRNDNTYIVVVLKTGGTAGSVPGTTAKSTAG